MVPNSPKSVWLTMALQRTAPRRNASCKNGKLVLRFALPRPQIASCEKAAPLNQAHPIAPL